MKQMPCNEQETKPLSEEEKEDKVLALLMQEADYNDVIDTEAFIKNLQQDKQNI